MPIDTDKNPSYGQPLVNQKYSPLANIAFDPLLRATYSALMTNRAGWLRNANRLGRPLRLATPGWAGVVEAEAGHHPPLVVISSNRSNWIQRGITAGDTQLGVLQNQQPFAGPSDLRALTALQGQTVSPPIYMPARVGPNRNVYIVVQMMEYRTYQRALANTGITPVGYEFDRVGGGPRGLSLVGFGASRFAAMEFCKHLRRRAMIGGQAPWNLAWLVDDNVVALGNFAGFTAVEGAVNAAQAVCAGFHGGTKAEAQVDNRQWARDELTAGRGGEPPRPPPPLPPSQPPGIVQQMSLWNVGYLDNFNLSFGPIYIASAEDLSIINYFNASGIPYLYYNGINVVKELTAYDDSFGAQKVNVARQRLTAWVTAAEAASTPPDGVPPPPLSVQPVDQGDGGVQSLGDFIVNRVLPNSLPDQATDVAVQNTAKCQAVEQITSGALNAGYVLPPGINAAFIANGGVVEVDLP